MEILVRKKIGLVSDNYASQSQLEKRGRWDRSLLDCMVVAEKVPQGCPGNHKAKAAYRNGSASSTNVLISLSHSVIGWEQSGESEASAQMVVWISKRNRLTLQSITPPATRNLRGTSSWLPQYSSKNGTQVLVLFQLVFMFSLHPHLRSISLSLFLKQKHFYVYYASIGAKSWEIKIFPKADSTLGEVATQLHVWRRMQSTHVHKYMHLTQINVNSNFVGSFSQMFKANSTSPMGRKLWGRKFTMERDNGLRWQCLTFVNFTKTYDYMNTF